LKNVFARAGVRLVGVPVGEAGIDPAAFERALREHKPRLAILTPTFQNPTGLTMSEAARRKVIEAAAEHHVVLVENDIYGPLRYRGHPLQEMKRLDDRGVVVQLRSFSKAAFPGLRVGWITGPRPLVARMVEAKQYSDLHTDQLSQAILLRFAETGRLEGHISRVQLLGRDRLDAALKCLEGVLPEGSKFTRPEGGMNLWVRLPDVLDTQELLPEAHRAGVSYMPGRYFGVNRYDASAFRLSFAGLPPERVAEGIGILGRVFDDAIADVGERGREPAPAMV
jgi:2-aminoadipate transaminase